jgi:hypothetical protein
MYVLHHLNREDFLTASKICNLVRGTPSETRNTCKEYAQYMDMTAAVLRIQTLLIRIRIMLFTLIRIRILLFNLIRIRPFDTDPDPYRFKEVMYLKQYFLHTFT